MGIHYESTVIGEVRSAGISGRAGVGMSELRFSLAWNLFPKRDHVYTVFGTSAWVSVAPDGETNATPLGQAMPESAWCEESRDGVPYDRVLMYRLSLPSSQLMVLEQLRQGRGLAFELDVRGNTYGPGGVRQLNETLRVAVNVSEWARVLKDAGSADVLLVGVHLPMNRPDHRSRAALDLVRKANEHLVHGHYTAAVAECRRAIESLWKSANLTVKARAARKLLATMNEQISMTRRDRELALGEAIRNFTNVAHHVGADAEPEIFGRLDAAMAVAATAGLISSLVALPDLADAPVSSDEHIAQEPVDSSPLPALPDKAIEHLRKHRTNRPRTSKTLRSALDSMVGRKLSAPEIDGLIEELKRRKVIIEAGGKLKYAEDL